VKIRWLGHACFLIELPDGKTIITDPFDRKLGYPEPAVPADIVTVSHQHFDHNAVEVVPGKPDVVQKEGRHSPGGIAVTGVLSHHDPVKGSLRGRNIIFIIEAGGLRICHLGDLGHVLDKKQLGEIGAVDVLLIPVGGHFTVGPAEAARVTGQLGPKYVVPMHYKTDYIDFPITGPDEFLKNFPGYRIEKELTVTGDDLPETTAAVLLELYSP